MDVAVSDQNSLDVNIPGVYTLIVTDEDNGCSATTTVEAVQNIVCLLYTSPSPRDATLSRMPSSA